MSAYPSSSAARRTSGVPNFASTTAAAFSPRSPPFLHRRRSSSPTRITNLGMGPTTPIRSQITSRRRHGAMSPASRSAEKGCACSPTTHPGSFRCSLHKRSSADGHRTASPSSSSNRLSMRRSAVANSLVRIGTVEGDLVWRSLAALIRPTSHQQQQRRREGFQPRRSRLSIMSTA